MGFTLEKRAWGLQHEPPEAEKNRRSRDHEQSRVDEKQIDPDVALTRAENTRFHPVFVPRIQGPHHCGGQGRPTPRRHPEKNEEARRQKCEKRAVDQARQTRHGCGCSLTRRCSVRARTSAVQFHRPRILPFVELTADQRPGTARRGLRESGLETRLTAPRQA